MAQPCENLHIIINPASGGDEPILNILNDVFQAHDIPWSPHITRASGDAMQMARQAIDDGTDLLLCYGGDGTVMEVVNEMVGSEVPLGILPGGTGNSVASELGIPGDLREAVEVAVTSQERRHLDVGRVGDRYFILRVFTGIGQDQVASREMKDKYGLLAYPISAFQFLREKEDAQYRLVLDGEPIEANGTICYVDNIGSFGGIRPLEWLEPLPADIQSISGSRTYKADVDPSDGLLDVILISGEVNPITALASFLLNVGEAQQQINYWQAKTISIEAEPPQEVWLDGESFGETPVEVEIVPSAIVVVVPETADTQTG